MIDTELWSIAKKKPERKKFPLKEEYFKALEAHEKARDFFTKIFPKLKIYMSTLQIAEIYHVLTFRGTRIPKEEALEIIKAIIEDESIVKVPVSLKHVEDAVKESIKNNIHVWDYLCFIPIKDYIDVVYTCDKHFITIGKCYKVEVINPINTWIAI